MTWLLGHKLSDLQQSLNLYANRIFIGIWKSVMLFTITRRICWPQGSWRNLRSAVLSGPPSIKCVISTWEKGQICLSCSNSGWTWDLGANSWISFGRFHIWMKFLTDVIKFGFRQKSFIMNAPLVSWAYWSSLLCGCNSKIVFLEKFTAQLLDLLNWTNFFSSFQNTFKIWMRVLVV